MVLLIGRPANNSSVIWLLDEALFLEGPLCIALPERPPPILRGLYKHLIGSCAYYRLVTNSEAGKNLSFIRIHKIMFVLDWRTIVGYIHQKRKFPVDGCDEEEYC
jgi:hypothetical protein